ncbi:MAG: sugar lactone lactonase YvrE [Oceanicoccus sp.]|jgi:sugar lactone lactonase YvrE
MSTSVFGPAESKLFTLSVFIFLISGVTFVSADECPSSGEYSFICGPKNAEDLVLVPETNWIIASGFGGGTSMYLIHSQNKTWSELHFTEAPAAPQNIQKYDTCSGSPSSSNFVAHGMNLLPGTNGHSTLYVVGHGDREAIEIFDVNANRDKPELTWTGCVMMPDGLAANSVASLGDGSLIATIPLGVGKTIEDGLAGELTGAVYQWSPGDAGFTFVKGTELPYPNGIEVSANGEEFYVASTGLGTVTAYSNSNPALQLRVTSKMTFAPDNLHMGPNGQLITAGLIANDPSCGNAWGPNFDLEKFAACPRPFIVKAINPQSMEMTDIVHGPVNANFSNITMALPVGNDIWIGTFAGDRIAYRTLKK